MSSIDDAVKAAVSALKNGEKPGETVYTDTPIIFTASSMKNYTPPEYLEMRRMQNSYEAVVRSTEWLFYQQAKLMENFEDSFNFSGGFSRYYPTYRDMSTEQLRGYFSWRAQVRKGSVKKTAPGFAFVYIFELLNGIGWTDKNEGYEKLCVFARDYEKADSSISLKKYIDRWKHDFILYYGLNLSLLESENSKNSAVLSNLMAETDDDARLFDNLNSMISHDLTKSPIYKSSPDDIINVVCGVYRGLEEYYQTHGERNIIRELFGKQTKKVYSMFDFAVFYESQRHEDTYIKVSETEKYECRNGRWNRLQFEFDSQKLRRLNTVLKNTDRLLRIKTGSKKLLKYTPQERYIDEIIENAVDSFLEEKKKKSIPVVSIDLSRLDEIRESAEIIQQKLTVYGEETEPEIGQESGARAEPETEQTDNEPVQLSACVAEEIPLDREQTSVLIALLKGEDTESYCRSRGLMLSVVCDGINEALYDLFDDNVIEFADSAEIIEDYEEELKKLTGVE